MAAHDGQLVAARPSARFRRRLRTAAECQSQARLRVEPIHVHEPPRVALLQGDIVAAAGWGIQ